MKRLAVFAAALLALGAVVQASGAGFDSGADVLKFRTMAPVDVPYTGPTNAIRGIGGAGAVWRINRGKGNLQESGAFEVQVRGLVLASTGTNPQSQFRAAVSCLSTDAAGAAVTVNRITEPFDATMPTGDAELETTIDLPSPCYAPIVFVGTGSGTFRWFAVTGR